VSLKTRKDIYGVTRVLDLIKGMGTGYTTSNNKQFLLLVDGTKYRVTFEKIGEGEEIEFVDIDNHLKD
jgi:hypothetical protein